MEPPPAPPARGSEHRQEPVHPTTPSTSTRRGESGGSSGASGGAPLPFAHDRSPPATAFTGALGAAGEREGGHVVVVHGRGR